MSPTLSSYHFMLARSRPSPLSMPAQPKQAAAISADLAAAITRAASSQTYFTIRFLADRPLVADAYRAYAYFRWVDDLVDQDGASAAGRLAFLKRQQEIIARCYQGDWPEGLCPQEQLVADLIHGDGEANSGLRTYIEQMMAVMIFDAGRKGRLVSEGELDAYTQALATAVTECLHHFIGHDDVSPPDEARYLAVTGAHITHLLRDMVEDTAVGYISIPREYLAAHGLAPTDIHHPAYRDWVRQRAQLARRCFAAGREALARMPNRRRRLAGFAYIGRFELVLDAIEKDDYVLRRDYPERKSKRAALTLGWTAVSQLLPVTRFSKSSGDLESRPTMEQR
ncbi:MAG: squalene/phytoene synthase family protein [Anaerolineae bacterium]|nr:squalene/phytoene synthase family protein [Anaerolineae bacterium]